MEQTNRESQSISLEGEIVELVEEDGRQRASVMLAPDAILRLTSAAGGDIHLGDRIGIPGSIRIERVRAVS